MAITHAPLVLAMIVPKPIRHFVFPLMFINHIATTKEDATSLQLAPRRTRKLPIHLPPFHYLISPESALLHSKLLLPPKASNAENPILHQPWPSPLPPAPTLLETPLPLPLPLLLLPPSRPPLSILSQKAESRPPSGTQQQPTRRWLLCTGTQRRTSP